MILLDANILIYSVNADASHHRKAKAFLETAMSGGETIGLSWNVLLAFLRVSTRPGLFSKPLRLGAALGLIDAWLQQPPVTILHPGPNHLRVLTELLTRAGTGGNLTSDTHLAALAIEHGAVLCSTDQDFNRFSRLKWRNPLA